MININSQLLFKSNKLDVTEKYFSIVEYIRHRIRRSGLPLKDYLFFSHF